MKIRVALASLIYCIFIANAFAQAPFSMSGFKYEVLSGGGHYFECVINACGVGSGISFEPQSGTQDVTTAEYEVYVRSNFSRYSSYEIVQVGKAMVRKVGSRRVVQMSYVTKPNETRVYWVVGFLLGGSERISLISSAPSGGRASQNFNLFANRLSRF